MQGNKYQSPTHDSSSWRMETMVDKVKEVRETMCTAIMPLVFVAHVAAVIVPVANPG